MTSQDIYNLFDSYFVQNKYTTIYLSLCKKAKERALSKSDAKKILGYVESHHIIPFSIDKSLDKIKANKVHLTAREHFFAHKLLIKIVKEEYKSKMVSAVMKFCQTNNLQKRNLRSIDYHYIRVIASENLSGKNNPMYGREGSIKNKIAITNGNETKFINKDENIPAGWYLGTHLKGFKTYTNGEKNILILSDSDEIPDGFRSGSILKGKPSSLKGRKIGSYSEDRINKQKMSIQGFRFYTNGIVDIKITDKQSIPDGFKPGRTHGILSEDAKKKYEMLSIQCFGFNDEETFRIALEHSVNIDKLTAVQLNRKYIKNKDINRNIPSLGFWINKFNLVPIKGKPGPKSQKI